jgi:hypothetical protein
MLRKILIISLILLSRAVMGQSNDVVGAANGFLNLLSDDIKDKIQFKYNDDERFDWHFVPKGRNGVSLHDLSQPQFEAAMNLLKESLSVQGFKKATDVIALESILREVEGRGPDDTYRDPKKYFFTIFGTPSKAQPWGWRLEGHHISLNFTSLDNKIQSSTPSFFGSNPAIIPQGKRKGEMILKTESDMGFAMVNSLSSVQLQSAIVSESAFPDIISSNKRKASLLEPKGLMYTEMNEKQKKQFMDLLEVYIKNYELGFSTTLMNKIKKAGIENLSFGWAGSLKPGKEHYYRIQGPMLLIEFDNTQNNANHIHSVVRDLTNDFAEDILKEHYAKEHTNK